MNNKKNYSLYHKMVYSHFTFNFIIILIMTAIFSIIADRLIINLYTHSDISAAEKSADNLSYAFQQNITLAYTLANDEEVIYNLRNFNGSSAIKQIDYDLALTDIFEKYYSYNSAIKKIRVFFPESVETTNNGYRSVCYLSTYNAPEWLCFFQPNSSAISWNYTCNIWITTKFLQDKKLIAVIIPIIMKNNETLAFLVMDIDKEILFDNYINSDMYTVVNNVGETIYNTAKYPIPKNNFSDIVKLSSNTYGNFRSNKDNIYYYATDYTKHGLKIICYKPYSSITGHRIMILIIFIISLIILLLITLVFVRKKSREFTEPLSLLCDAINKSEAVVASDDYANEIKVLYNAYDNLLLENSKMLDTIKENDEKQHRLEIKMLLAQISPHFLYNTLNTVVWKAAKSGQKEICSILSRLAKLCKLNYSSTNVFVPLETELMHIELYLNIQQEAFERPFDYKIDVTDETAQLKVPRFILQPIVENAILHGFYQLPESGHISVAASADNGLLTITVTDNGSGITEDILTKLNSNNYKTEKYGIRNINQRIKMLCGEKYGIIFESNGNNYTKAVITLPVIDETNTK